ncbi:hypothetical protein [Algoriphagus chordae]|uniref:Uncharacterized protein n=1 Tax=Algoriphagus chordae TaxID=237019 RepID=A0A2W7QNZ8_9BACT|nr:hypothetical protein [Algoriphagus chordae]PZX50223.1 hypothetical protein LV85_02841 [Algoriphagus chordae]
MNEYSPKPDLWSKIQQRRDFDSQVASHARNLPERMPKADLWNSIESELDKKTPVVPLWKYGMAAASIALILAISGIAYLQFGDKDTEAQLITERSPVSTEPIATETIPPIQKESEESNAIEIKVEQPTAPLRKEVVKNIPTPIEIPTLDLPDLSIENTLISEVIIPKTAEVEVPQTLHKVQISWGFQDKSKLRTTFGAAVPEDISNQQIGRADQTPNSIKIRFKKQ